MGKLISNNFCSECQHHGMTQIQEIPIQNQTICYKPTEVKNTSLRSTIVLLESSKTCSKL